MEEGVGADGGGVGAFSTAAASSAASARASSRASSAADPADPAPPLAFLELGLGALPEAARLGCLSLDLSAGAAGAVSLPFSLVPVVFTIQEFLPVSFKFKMRFDLLYPTFLQHRTIQRIMYKIVVVGGRPPPTECEERL